MECLLYISESQTDDTDATKVVADIIAGAQIRNFNLGLTGALFFTGSHFAQILEGPSVSIAKLLLSLHRDQRHSNIVIIDRAPVTARKFAEWKMAYHGPSQFVSRHVTRLLDSPSQSEQRRATEWLTDLALEFTHTL